MSISRPVTLSRDEAKALCRQVGWTILVPIGIVIVGSAALSWLPQTAHNHVLTVGGVAVLLTVVAFYILLGRLAHGIGRSAVYWCGGTFILQKFTLIIAWIIAWYRIRVAVKDTAFLY